MRDLLLRKLKMYNAVLAVLHTWNSIWNHLSAFTDDSAQLEKYINDIELNTRNLKDSTLVSEEKKQKFGEMIDGALAVCGAGTSYANKIKHHALAKAFNYVPSTLKAGNEEDVCNRCLGIAEAAELIKVQLINHNLPNEQITALIMIATDFQKLISAPHVAIKNHKSINAGLEQLYRDCDQFLKGQLDKDMNTFARTQPSFFAEYTTSREIGGWSQGDDEAKGGGVVKEGEK